MSLSLYGLSVMHCLCKFFHTTLNAVPAFPTTTVLFIFISQKYWFYIRCLQELRRGTLMKLIVFADRRARHNREQWSDCVCYGNIGS
ncbi:hypothetical protein SKAU_G00153930 [Synaphobranchus kaupii]|uniref:Uncharacterized protein n=1 Tax=Synaphobranchus kaupii TaxID=118154 RepID=A0A9Q1FH60_SYNKA|nr:hypothetical protein SKAU_G00153930 [Synaphobranchus kaupii]